MSYLILVRHGQSVWNLEKKFTGWVDVDLTENGKLEAKKAGNLIKSQNINIDIFYSSFQLRAKNTLKLIKEILQDITISNEAWQLNERHYGALTGLNKDEMKIKLGEEKVHQFRRSWDLRPDPLDKNNPYHPMNIETYKEIPINKIVLETDSPYLAPSPHRGSRNESSYLKIIADKLAEVYNLEIDEICKITQQNSIEVFGN